MKYGVTIYATPVGALHMNNSIRRTYVVKAASVEDARHAAIKAAYVEGGMEHVNPRAVREV